MGVDKASISAELVSRMVAAQFPAWAGLPVRPVELDGNDNTTFRLGDVMSVRLPSAAGYAAQVDKEGRWLPVLAKQLPLPIPEVIAVAEPDELFPWPWSVRRWLDGYLPTTRNVPDASVFADDVARFLVSLQGIDTSEGPPADRHSYNRGGPLIAFDAQTRETIAALGGLIDTERATRTWAAALTTLWNRPPVWVHGDIAPTNLLATAGRLSGVLDFGCLAVGDPACDLAIAWTFFDGAARERFQRAIPLDEGTWLRGRGWALWKALLCAREAGPDGSAAADGLRARQGWARQAVAVVNDLVGAS